LSHGRGLEVISKWPGEDEDHAEVEEGEVVVGFAVAAGGDPAFCFQPGVGALDGPAVTRLRVACLQAPLLPPPDLARDGSLRDRLSGLPTLADPGFDLAFAECLFECLGVVAAVCPQLAGTDAALEERVDQR
jgi:hypothetical protein